MISVEEALDLIGRHHRDPGNEYVSLREAAGRVLAQDVFADRDFPPYDRVTMDGIAISSAAFIAGQRAFLIARVQPAGRPASVLENDQLCIEVMTGSVLPQGADAVIPYEDCLVNEGVASVSGTEISGYLKNIHPQGTDSRRGDLLVRNGQRISPATVGILASVGVSQVLVKSLPRIAVCGTGDELVGVGETPLPHQVRQSNSYMLAAVLHAAGIAADVFHLPDNAETLRARIGAMLPVYDAILFSGAVSKGKFDFLPAVLTDLGMQTVFHRVAQKPGKPMLFGVFDEGPVLFGFPGNPVSTLVCYTAFFRPWLECSTGVTAPVCSARLAADVTFRPALTYHLLVTLRYVNGVLEATPCAGVNSGDMVSLQNADGIITLPAGKEQFLAGEAYPVQWLTSRSC